MSASSTSSRAAADGESVLFFARLVRLLYEVEELNRELERIETETQDAIGRGSLLRLRGFAETQ